MNRSSFWSIHGDATGILDISRSAFLAIALQTACCLVQAATLDPVAGEESAMRAAASTGDTAAPASSSAPRFVAQRPDTGRQEGAASAYDLEKVRVTAGAKRFRRESDAAARMPLKNLENPQVYSVIPKELTQEQMAVDFKSVFKNVAGSGQPQVTVQGLSRYSTRGFFSANQIRNGMPINTNSEVDLANVERVEAIRGPSGTLFGAAAVSYGGLFNRVAKRPYETFGGEVSYSGGSWNLSRITADLNMPLNPDKTALLRVNTAIHKESSDLDQGFSDAWLIAPSLAYQVNDRLSLLADAATR